jgi:phage repressor protein C with HTH and peptisase S24 domain
MATRIETYLAAKNGGNQSEMARYIGVSPQAVQKWIAGLAEPRGKNLEMAAAFLGVTPARLKFGTPQDAGEGEIDPDTGLKVGTFMRVRAVDEDDPSLVRIPKVKLRLSAGLSGFEIEPESYDGSTTTVPTDWMQRRGYNREKLLATRVKGESMEPTFYEDDLVVINTADKTPLDGEVYAINYEGEPVVKRMERDAGDWWLKSDNPDQRKFSRKICRGDACIIIGRVVRKESERF